MKFLAVLCLACTFRFLTVEGFSLKLQPGYLNIVVDARPLEGSLDVACLKTLQTAGVDSFLLNDKDDLSGLNINTLENQQYSPLSERSSIPEDFRLWLVSSTDPSRLVTTTDPKREAFVLCGDDLFVVQTMNTMLAPGSNCLWRPPQETQQQLLDRTNNPIPVWRLRSNPGIMGLVLDWDENIFNEKNIGGTAASFRKLRQPCSAMDYPPTIYMIGEDEQR